MQSWFNKTTGAQRFFLFLLAILLVAFGAAPAQTNTFLKIASLVPLLVLIFLMLGRRKKALTSP